VGLSLGAAIAKIEAMLDEDLPPGFRYDWAGEAEDLRETGTEVWWFIIVALVIVYMVLASQFESLIHPVTVILAVPLAGLGAFGLLWLIHQAGLAGWLPELSGMNSNLFSKIGVMLLIGLVTKNSILLVEFANQQMVKGKNARDAMIQSGILRLRPILMTAFSTIAGIMPIAIGFGAGAESRRPMGIAVVGGMLTSTFLTLIVIPVFYTLFNDLRKRKNPESEGSRTHRKEDFAN
jgi:multidrug efflux pump subunit AcrB